MDVFKKIQIKDRMKAIKSKMDGKVGTVFDNITTNLTIKKEGKQVNALAMNLLDYGIS